MSERAFTGNRILRVQVQNLGDRADDQRSRSIRSDLMARGLVTDGYQEVWRRVPQLRFWRGMRTTTPVLVVNPTMRTLFPFLFATFLVFDADPGNHAAVREYVKEFETERGRRK